MSLRTVGWKCHDVEILAKVGGLVDVEGMTPPCWGSKRWRRAPALWGGGALL